MTKDELAKWLRDQEIKVSGYPPMSDADLAATCKAVIVSNRHRLVLERLNRIHILLRARFDVYVTKTDNYKNVLLIGWQGSKLEL